MEDRELARLLSGRNEPSVLEKEALLDRVLADVAPPPRSTLRPWGVAALAAAAAGLLLWWLPGTEPEFASRGGEGAAVLRAVCVETQAIGRCASGGTLVFMAEPPENMRNVGLFARGADGFVVWYLPRASEPSLALDAGDGEQRLGEGFRLGPAQPAGRYELFAVFSSEPLTREQLKERLGPELAGDPSLRIVRQTLIVEPSQ